MKLSAALRKASTIFKPCAGVWFKSETEACAGAAIAYVMSGSTLEDIRASFGKDDYNFHGAMEEAYDKTQEVKVTTFPVSQEQMLEGWNKFWKAGGREPLAFPPKMGAGSAIMILNDGLGMGWEQIAQWLESQNL